VTLGRAECLRCLLPFASAQVEHVAVAVLGRLVELVWADVDGHRGHPTCRGLSDCGKAVTTRSASPLNSVTTRIQRSRVPR
jgi:hypothetical protein